MEKRYIIRKYVVANSISAAIRKEKKTEVDEIWIDKEPVQLSDAVGSIGFRSKEDED